MPVYGNKITDYLRTVLTGAGRPSVGVSVRKHTGDTEVVATTTDGNGKFTASFADGSPGPVYYRTTDGGDTRTHSGQSTGQVGTFFASSLPNIFQVFRDGYIPGVGGECAPSATGAGMTVTVADGVVLAAGHPYPRTASGTVTITAAHATLPRIDLIVVRLYVPGTAEEGRMELVVKAGTAAASPVSPTVQQDTTYWEVAIAQVAVDAAVTSIASGKVTDVRVAASLKPPIIFNSDDANTLLIEKTSPSTYSAGGTGVDVLRVNNSGSVPEVQFPMGTILRGFTNAYGNQTWSLDPTTGTLTLGSNLLEIRTGTATPEGAITSPAGSLYLRTDGTIYRKASGTGNTGWVNMNESTTTYRYATLGPFHFTNVVAGGVTAGKLPISTADATFALTQQDLKIGAAGNVVGARIASNAARTAGTATALAVINGGGSSAGAVLNATNPAAAGSSGTYASFTATDNVTMWINTDAAWAPTTADMVGWLDVRIAV